MTEGVTVMCYACRTWWALHMTGGVLQATSCATPATHNLSPAVVAELAALFHTCPSCGGAVGYFAEDRVDVLA